MPHGPDAASLGEGFCTARGWRSTLRGLRGAWLGSPAKVTFRAVEPLLRRASAGLSRPERWPQMDRAGAGLATPAAAAEAPYFG